MHVFHDIGPMQRWVREHRRARRIAFVPTMGALHDGHGACVRTAAAVDDARVVASIFVNPAQFGPGEDLERYPRTLEADVEKLAAWGCEAVFAPEAAVMYPEAQRAWVEVEGVAGPLCGRFRPGHFRGVATVVAKLFHLVAPDVAVFGQKDAQQALVIRAMVRQLDFGVELRLARTVREADGLAMSSRNRFLSPDERGRALGLWLALCAARDALAAGERDARAVEAAARSVLEARGVERIDYVELRDARDLSALERARGRAILAVAARVGATRLIDNMVFDVRTDGVSADVDLFGDGA